MSPGGVKMRRLLITCNDRNNHSTRLRAADCAPLWGFLRTRFLSFAMVAGVCFLLLVSLAIEALLKGFSHYIQSVVPGGLTIAVSVYLIFDFALITTLFAMIFKILPRRFSFDRQMGAWFISWQWHGRVGLCRSRFAHHVAALGLLLVANLTFRRRVHPGLCRSSRARSETG